MAIQKSVGNYRVSIGKLIGQFTITDASDDANNLTSWFESAIDGSGVLRRIGKITVRAHEQLRELQVDVEHRPMATPVSLHLVLKQILQGRHDGIASEVFGVAQREPTHEELVTELATLNTAADNMALPLPLRRDMFDQASRLRLVVGDAAEQ